MATSSVRITGDTSGLTSSLERVGDVIDREREKIEDFSNSIKNIPNVNSESPFNNNLIATVLNSFVSQPQVVPQNGVPQQTSNNSGGNNVFKSSKESALSHVGVPDFQRRLSFLICPDEIISFICSLLIYFTISLKYKVYIRLSQKNRGTKKSPVWTGDS